MLTVRIQEKNYSESIMVLKLKDGAAVLEGKNAQDALRLAAAAAALAGSEEGAAVSIPVRQQAEALLKKSGY